MPSPTRKQSDPIDFQLEDSDVTYSTGGDFHTATYIALIAPSSKNRRECAYLRQAFMQALPKRAPGEAPPTGDTVTDPADITGEDVISMLAMSSVDLAEVLEVGRRLLCSGVALLDGSAELKPATHDQLSMDDAANLLGAYLVGFILRSTLRNQKTT